MSSLLMNSKSFPLLCPAVRYPCQISVVYCLLWYQASKFLIACRAITGEEGVGKLTPKGPWPMSFGAVVVTGLKGQISKLWEESVS